MKILICGAGAIGSQLVRSLIPDLKGEHEITVLDMDIVEKRNIVPGTQWYTMDQIGLPKVEALQFNVYKAFERDIQILDGDIRSLLGWLKGTIHNAEKFDLIVDCFDNHEARRITQQYSVSPLIHIGFSDRFTFEVEWAEWYAVPTNITTGMDICEMPGAAGFINSVASLGALVIESYLETGEKMRVLGGKYQRSLVS